MSGRTKNTQAMSPTEVDEHIVRLGGPEAVAQALGCSRSTLYRWTTGTRNVPIRWAARLRGLTLPLPAPRKRGRPKNVQAMTLAEFREHRVRVGGQKALREALRCSRNALARWSNGRVNITAVWAARIRALPDAPPSLLPAALRQLPLPFEAAKTAEGAPL